MTSKKLRQQLERDFSADLSSRKDFINRLITAFINGDGSGATADSSSGSSSSGDAAGAKKSKPAKVKAKQSNGAAKSGDGHESETRKDAQGAKEQREEGGAAAAAGAEEGEEEQKQAVEEDETETQEERDRRMAVELSETPDRPRSDRRPQPRWSTAQLSALSHPPALLPPLPCVCSRHAAEESLRKAEKRKQKAASGGAAKKARSSTRPPNLLYLSPALSELLDGELQLTRGDVMKRLWQYIKQHELQDRHNGRRIVLDDRLKAVFGRDRKTVEMFRMTALLSKHLYKEHEV